MLITHFEEHQQRNPAVDPLSFLSMHYFGEDNDDKDEERDMQLPFKKLDYTFAPVFHTFKSYQVSVIQYEVFMDYVGYQEAHFVPVYCGSPFKPPRS